jgi:hypothetical protein
MQINVTGVTREGIIPNHGLARQASTFSAQWKSLSITPWSPKSNVSLRSDFQRVSLQEAHCGEAVPMEFKASKMSLCYSKYSNAKNSPLPVAWRWLAVMESWFSWTRCGSPMQTICAFESVSWVTATSLVIYLSRQPKRESQNISSGNQSKNTSNPSVAVAFIAESMTSHFSLDLCEKY